MLSKSVMNAIALIVTGVWTLSFLAQFVFPEIKPDPQINIIFGTLVGGAFALPKLLGSKKNEDEERPKEPTGGHHRRDE